MSKQKNNADARHTKTKTRTRSRILYITAVIVILIPVLLLAYIYLGAKENSGKPVVGNRFDHSLDPAISEQDVQKVETSMHLDGVDKVEINLKSATLRILLDTKDDLSEDAIEQILDDAYDQVNKLLPVKTYFSNQSDGTKMYDLDIHAYNFIPDDKHSAEDQIYKEKVKNAASKKAVTDTLSSPRNADEAEELLKQQEKAKK